MMRISVVLACFTAAMLSGCVAPTTGPLSAIAGLSVATEGNAESLDLLYVRGHETAREESRADGMSLRWGYGYHDRSAGLLYEDHIQWGRPVVLYHGEPVIVNWQPLHVEGLLDSSDLPDVVPRPDRPWSPDGWHERSYWLSNEAGRPVWQVVDHVFDEQHHFERLVTRIDARTGERVEDSPVKNNLRDALGALEVAADALGGLEPVEARYVERDNWDMSTWSNHRSPLAIPDIEWRDGRATSWSIILSDGPLLSYGDVRWDGSFVLSAPRELGWDPAYPKSPGIERAPFDDLIPGPNVPTLVGYSYQLRWTGEQYLLTGGVAQAGDVGRPATEDDVWDWEAN